MDHSDIGVRSLVEWLGQCHLEVRNNAGESRGVSKNLLLMQTEVNVERCSPSSFTISEESISRGKFRCFDPLID
jgi:hypothetical protein